MTAAAEAVQKWFCYSYVAESGETYQWWHRPEDGSWFTEEDMLPSVPGLEKDPEWQRVMDPEHVWWSHVHTRQWFYER